MSDILARPVWEVISDVNNVSEAQARQICMDFTLVGCYLPADGIAQEYEELVVGICESMESPDIREAMLNGDEEITMTTEDEGDPFYYNTKVNTNELSKYFIHHKSEYDCVICGDNDISTGGVQLSCSLRKKGPCRSVFCKDCVGPWLSTCVARCPNCREFCQEIKNLPVVVMPKPTSTSASTSTPDSSQRKSPNIRKRRVVITIKKKDQE